MDGLSAVASGMGVASLAIQLVDSVREIRRFFRALKDAPEELSRLLDLLDHMELMLGYIVKLVDPDSDISPSVLKAIQTCETALNKLDVLIQKVKRNSAAQTPLKRSLGFFRLACKKQEVEEIEKQLDRAVSNLNMVMTALNLHGIQRLSSGVLTINASTATITEVALRMEAAANQKGSKQKLTDSNWSQTSSSSVSRRSTTYKVVYRGFLGSIVTGYLSESEDSDEGGRSKEPYARDQWSWIFIPSFLSRCVQVQCVSSMGSVERTLRTCPILPDFHPAWNLCKYGKVASIQELFSTREISPFAINKTGETLLHVATGWYQSEMCRLLLNMGVGADVVDAYGGPVRGLIVLSETCDDIESTYRVFIAAKAANDDMDIAEFCDEYFRTLQDFSVEFFRSRVEKWVTEENVNLFNPSPLEVVTRRLCNLSIDLIEFHKWKDIAFYLIAKKAEFHILDDERHGNTCLLEVAVTSVAHAFDAQIIGTRFLEMLDASNVDLAEYLTFELQHHLEGLLAPKVGICIQQRPWYQSPDPRTIKLDIHEEKLFSLSWDWWLDPKEMGFIVCHEFRHFGRAEHFLYSDSRDHEGLFHWPFIYPDWAIDLNRQTNWKGMVLPTYLQQRYDHRWQKKKIKEAKIQGTYKKPKMPGTWID